MTKPWLTGLSDEWISQPTPPGSVRDVNGASAAQASQSVPPKPQSRLPRMRQSSGSFSEIQVRHVARDLRPPKPRSALAERSLSDNNVSSFIASEDQQVADSRCASQSFATLSGESMIYDGTVAHKPTDESSEKDRPAQKTPEWRKRLLNGDVGYGDKKDLFSPMGLENIFEKPKDHTSEASKPSRSKLGMFKGLSMMPSSPPPWPSAERDHQTTASANDAGESVLETQQPRESSVSFNPAQVDRQVSETSAANDSSSNSVLRLQDNRDGTRTVSGQTEFDNENFSPVYLTTNLKVGATATPIPQFRGSDLAHRLRHIGSPPLAIDNHQVSEPNYNSQEPSRIESSLAKDDTLPDDLPAGTPELADVGRNVELKRGGYSRDGSFRRRPLSPSPQAKINRRVLREIAAESQSADNSEEQNDETSMSGLPSDAQLASKDPTTPSRRPKSNYLSPDRANASTSPLKLFDAHDTFTSNRLQRRLSQLEYKSEKAAGVNHEEETTKMVQKISRITSVEEVSVQKATNGSSPSQSPHVEVRGARRVGTFGQGELDQHGFPEGFSSLCSQDSSGQESCPDESPSMDAMPPGSHQPLRFTFDGSPQSRKSSRGTKRQGLTRVSNPFRSTSLSKPQGSRKVLPSKTETEEVLENEYAEGKRGPTSPFKNPTPKRRRTLQLEVEEEDEIVVETGFNSTKETHAAMQSVIGRKRKDARQDTSMNIADPEVLARRAILRPRNPTPSQRRREEIHAEIYEATDAFILSSPKLNTIREQLDSPSGSNGASETRRAVEVANEVAAFSMKRAAAIKTQSRKRSVTTQDFLDEAVKIMDYIRTKGRPTSGLGSLEETESEHHIEDDGLELPSTPLSFSRPPSREGRMSQWREPNRHQLDPNMMNHLRKFQEQESDDFMGSSMHSLRVSRMKGPVSPESRSVVVEQNNIRITDNLGRHDRDSSEEDNGVESGPRTNSTHPSTGSSIGQTIATSTSRKSDHVATLAPEAVAHLIPEQIAGMSFDREKNIWIRQKSPSKEHRPAEDISSTNESEEDPFGHIPDLTVNESVEALNHQSSPSRPQPIVETFLEDSADNSHSHNARPETREGMTIPAADTSSVPSKVSNFAWSFPKTETRATSWSDQETRKMSTQNVQRLRPTYSIPESDELDIEHEIKYFEGRRSATPTMLPKAKLRDITFSIEQDTGTQIRADEHSSNARHNDGSHWMPSYTERQSNIQRSAWQHVAGSQTVPHLRPLKHVNAPEASDMEVPPSRNYRMQLSMSVAAPVFESPRKGTALAVPTSPAKGDVTFLLSDLPEFTLHQVDECELPDRVIVKHDGVRFSQALEDRYAQGTADLIKALQDVVPDEPYWEDLRRVNLSGKGLSSLHRLDEFCCGLEELDFSENNVSQVKGIPYTMRRLWAQKNCLTGLTSWVSLMHLQYLDISNNDIDSLDGLGDLVHLRTLKVDNNKVTSLEGILHLDGLLELSANGNSLEHIDFAISNLKSITELRLRGNSIKSVRSLDRLQRLQLLDLDDNRLEEFPEMNSPEGRCIALDALHICRNELVSLHIDTHFPNLQSLFIDGNSLTDVSGLQGLKNLRTLSAREQHLNRERNYERCVGNLLANADIRILNLSSNPTPMFGISQHLLNLQQLELASMGLESLPDDFGQLTPNLRSINLNFNSIKDLRPLLNIKRLDELLIAGNKIGRLRTNLAVLGKLTTLTKVDLRENPLTLRFYPPASENRIISLRRKPSEEDANARFVLPAGSPDEDQQYLERLDFETRLRRRVQEIMFSTQCRGLRELDGLPFNKARILKKDDIWERLSYLGVIRKAETSEQDAA